MSILVNTGFKVGSAAPLNEYSIRETVDDRDALVTDGYVYEGMEVYCKDTKIKYRWTGVTWNEIGSGGTVDLSGYAKTYTTLEDLGLTAPVTVGEIFNAMPSKTMAVLSCEAKDESVGTVTVSDIPESYGVLTIKKNGVGRLSIEYQNSSYNTSCNVKKWIGTLKGADGTGLYWKQLSTEPTFIALTDIGLTADATFQDVIDKMPKGSSAILGVKEFTNYQTIFPYEEGNDQFARVHIIKGVADGSCMYARWFRKDGSKEAIAIFNTNDNTFNGWKKLYTDETRVTTLETQVNELFQNAPNLATKEYVDSKLGKESINDSITSTTDVWSSSKTKSYVDTFHSDYTSVAQGKSYDTGWKIKKVTNGDMCRIAVVNIYDYSQNSGGSKMATYLYLITANYTDTTTLNIAKIISNGNTATNDLFEFSVSSAGTIVFKNNSDSSVDKMWVKLVKP